MGGRGEKERKDGGEGKKAKSYKIAIPFVNGWIHTYLEIEGMKFQPPPLHFIWIIEWRPLSDLQPCTHEHAQEDLQSWSGIKIQYAKYTKLLPPQWWLL